MKAAARTRTPCGGGGAWTGAMRRMPTSRMHSITSAHPGLAVPPRESRSGLVHVIIDTPAGSRDKFKYAPKLQLFGKSRVLPAMMSFAHDFGSIPGTRAAEA